MWYADDGHMDGAWGVVMALGMMGAWLAIAAAVVWAVVWATRASGGTSPGSARADRILAERFARGEIDAEEYRSRLDELRSGSQ